MPNFSEILHRYCHCCFSAIDEEEEPTELQTSLDTNFDMPPRWPEPIYHSTSVPRHPLIDTLEARANSPWNNAQSFTSSLFDNSPSSPDLNIPADSCSNKSTSASLQCSVRLPKSTQPQRHHESIETLNEFHKIYAHVEEVLNELPYNSTHWMDVMRLHHNFKSFLNNHKPDVATDAHLDTKSAAEGLRKEWVAIQAVLREEGALVQLVFEEEFDEEPVSQGL